MNQVRVDKSLKLKSTLYGMCYNSSCTCYDLEICGRGREGKRGGEERKDFRMGGREEGGTEEGQGGRREGEERRKREERETDSDRHTMTVRNRMKQGQVKANKCASLD